jgi:hypothetical protein
MPSTSGDPEWCDKHLCDMHEVCPKCTAEDLDRLRGQLTTKTSDLEIARAALTDIAAGLHLVESRPRAVEALKRMTSETGSGPGRGSRNGDEPHPDSLAHMPPSRRAEAPTERGATYDSVFAEAEATLSLRTIGSCPDMQRVHISCVWTCRTCHEERPATVGPGPEYARMPREQRQCALTLRVPTEACTCLDKQPGFCRATIHGPPPK